MDQVLEFPTKISEDRRRSAEEAVKRGAIADIILLLKEAREIAEKHGVALP